MTLRERMLNNAVLCLQRELLRRVGNECAAGTSTLRAFQAEARAMRRNPFELIPIYLAWFDSKYGEALQSMRLKRRGRMTPEGDYPMLSRESPTAPSRRPQRPKPLGNDGKTPASARSYIIRSHTRRQNARDLFLLDRLSLLGAASLGPEEAAVLLATDRETPRACLERLVAAQGLKPAGNGRYCPPPFMRLLAQEQMALAASAARSGRFPKGTPTRVGKKFTERKRSFPTCTASNTQQSGAAGRITE
jgi:hypothetical protein